MHTSVPLLPMHAVIDCCFSSQKFIYTCSNSNDDDHDYDGDNCGEKDEKQRLFHVFLAEGFVNFFESNTLLEKFPRIKFLKELST